MPKILLNLMIKGKSFSQRIKINKKIYDFLTYKTCKKTLTCTLDSPGCEKDREKKGFHRLLFAMSKLILIGDVCSWMLSQTCARNLEKS